MNAAHLHVALSHFPIFGAMIATGIFVWAWIRNNVEIQRTGLLVMLAAAIVAIPVFLTGEGAEEVAEKLSGVRDAAIEAHEDMAKITFWLMQAAGALSLVQLIAYYRKNTLSKTLLILTLVIGLAVSALAGYTGWQGGKIRHTEFGNSVTDGNAMENEKGSSSDDD